MKTQEKSASFTCLAKRISPKRRRDLTLSIIVLLILSIFIYFSAKGWVLGSYEMRIARLCGVYAIAALSMNLINGFTGQFSLGQAGFMAIGAYVTSLLIIPAEQKATIYYVKPIVSWLANVQLPFFLALIIGGLVAALAAFLIGFPVLRLRGDYLAIATLGFSEIIRIIITNAISVTNGSLGLKNIPDTANLWWTTVCAVVVVIFMLRLMKTSYGRALKAIRDDDVAAESMGISLFKHKMISFVTSGFLAGLSGGLLASVVGAITPNYFRFTLAYDILLIVVLGGMGSISGSVLAAGILTIAREKLRFLDAGMNLGFVQFPAIDGMRMLVFSVLLMVIILFYRRGLFGSNEFSWEGTFRLCRSAVSWVGGLFRRKTKGGAGS